MVVRRIVLVLACVVAGAWAARGAEEARWYKGNLHTHSLWSDGDEFPERIAEWYRERGYDFLGISDHNTLQRGDKWVKHGDLVRKGAGASTDAYLKAYEGRAKTRGSRAAKTFEIRLTPFEEYRKWVERPGKFILIPCEEVTDKFQKKPIHMGGINVTEVVKPKGGMSVVEVISNNLRAIREQGERTGRPVMAHLNHPNFGWGVTAAELAEVVDEPFFEVYNGHPEVHQPGDKDHPSIDHLWDVANTLRMTAYKARPLMGLGSDDSHNYHAEGLSRAAPGRGWNCVRASKLDAGSLLAAMAAGDFYASSGVVLTDVKYDKEAGTLDVRIAADGAAKYTTRFVGSAVGAGTDLDKVGVTFATAEGLSVRYKLTGNELYVRAVVTSDQAPVSPSFKGQKRQAWTQPVGWERVLGK